MRREVILLAAVAASACVYRPRSVTREVSIGVEESPPTDLGGFAGWQITTRIEPDMANIGVTVARLQACERGRSETYDELETEQMEVSMLGGVEFPPAVVLFLPVTALTALVAKIQMSGHGETKRRKTRSLPALRGTCPHGVADAPVELTLPSGAVLAGTTGADGRVQFAIPDAEPESGTAITRVGDETRLVAFFKTTESCVRARARIFSLVMGSATVDERVRWLLGLPTTCGDARARSWTLTATAALAAAGSRCASIERLGDQLRAVDHDLYASFVVEPDIAQCLDGRIEARLRRAACIEHRRALMLGAQQSGVRQRTRILTGLPVCDAAR